MKYTQSWIYTPDFLGKHFLLQSWREEILSYYLIFTGILKPIKKKKRIFFREKGQEKELRLHVVKFYMVLFYHEDIFLISFDNTVILITIIKLPVRVWKFQLRNI